MIVEESRWWSTVSLIRWLWREGRLWSTVYHLSQERRALLHCYLLLEQGWEVHSFRVASYPLMAQGRLIKWLHLIKQLQTKLTGRQMWGCSVHQFNTCHRNESTTLPSGTWARPLSRVGSEKRERWHPAYQSHLINVRQRSVEEGCHPVLIGNRDWLGTSGCKAYYVYNMVNILRDDMIVWSSSLMQFELCLPVLIIYADDQVIAFSWNYTVHSAWWCQEPTTTKLRPRRETEGVPRSGLTSSLMHNKAADQVQVSRLNLHMMFWWCQDPTMLRPRCEVSKVFYVVVLQVLSCTIK